MITGRDFIITSLQSWDIAIGSNAKDIAREIAKKQPGTLCQYSYRYLDIMEKQSCSRHTTPQGCYS